MNDALVALLKDSGAVLVGFADLAPVAEDVKRGLPRAVSFALLLNPRIVAEIREGPTDEYFEEYKRLNALLAEAAQAGAELLVAAGYKAVALLATGDIGEGWRAPFQHKTAARLAGLGWIGKCALLVTPEYGPALRWNTILTDAPLTVAATPLEPGCGECRVCVELCPGHAGSGKMWQEGMAREEFFDPQACLAGMKKIAAQRQTISPVCGMCVANCPYTVKHLERAGVL